MDEQLFKPGDLVWFEPGIGFPLPGEVLEIHEAAQITVIGTSIDGKVRKYFNTTGFSSGTLTLTGMWEVEVLWNLRLSTVSRIIVLYTHLHVF